MAQSVQEGASLRSEQFVRAVGQVLLDQGNEILLLFWVAEFTSVGGEEAQKFFEGKASAVFGESGFELFGCDDRTGGCGLVC